MKVLVTGAARFIGPHFSRWLLDREWEIIGLYNLTQCLLWRGAEKCPARVAQAVKGICLRNCRRGGDG